VSPPYPDPDRPGVYRVPLGGQVAEGREAIIDAESLPLVDGGACYLARTGSKGPHKRPGAVYVSVLLPDGTHTPLRRVVMGMTGRDDDRGGALHVGHANGDPLDCRRSNLVVLTAGQRARGARKFGGLGGRACSSRFKGVCWVKREKKWQAKIVANGKRRWLGCFDDEIAAAEAYDEAAKELFGEHAWLNFPDGIDAYLEREARERETQVAA
jgi:hypothetical protein